MCVLCGLCELRWPHSNVWDYGWGGQLDQSVFILWSQFLGKLQACALLDATQLQRHRIGTAGLAGAAGWHLRGHGVSRPSSATLPFLRAKCSVQPRGRLLVKRLSCHRSHIAHDCCRCGHVCRPRAFTRRSLRIVVASRVRRQDPASLRRPAFAPQGPRGARFASRATARRSSGALRNLASAARTGPQSAQPARLSGSRSPAHAWQTQRVDHGVSQPSLALGAHACDLVLLCRFMSACAERRRPSGPRSKTARATSACMQGRAPASNRVVTDNFRGKSSFE